MRGACGQRGLSAVGATVMTTGLPPAPSSRRHRPGNRAPPAAEAHLSPWPGAPATRLGWGLPAVEGAWWPPHMLPIEAQPPLCPGAGGGAGLGGEGGRVSGGQLLHLSLRGVCDSQGMGGAGRM